MRTSQRRKTDGKLRTRYIAIIENSKERPWDERSDKILEAFFLTDKTYREIADEVGISESRIGQILDKQVRRILHPTGLEKLWNPNFDPDKEILTPEYIGKIQTKLEQQYGTIENWPIKEMPFSPRVRNGLLRADINTMDKLVERVPNISKIRGFGKKALSEINDILNKFQLL